MSPRKTLVFLHAFGSSADAWREVIARLPDDIDTLALDLPGFGGQPDQVQADSVHDYAGWVVAEVAKRSLDSFVLVGWSMGGKIGLATALQKPRGLRGLILVATSPPGPEPMEPGARNKERRSFHDEDAAKEAVEQVAGEDVSSGAIKTAVDGRMNATRSAWDFWLDVGSREDISDEVEALTLPIVVITGGDDEHLGPEQSAAHVEPKLFNFKSVVIQGSGHLIPLEKPIQLAEEIGKAMSAISLG